MEMQSVGITDNQEEASLSQGVLKLGKRVMIMLQISKASISKPVFW